jgi:carotenoid cleavage dioxygenase-like enzyme
MSTARLHERVSNRGFAVGFRSVESEYTDESVPVEGAVPEWLSGTLVRNGPGKFEVGGERLQHWFDGLAMLRAYEFDDGRVRYSNRFLRTESYADALAGRATGQFATDERGLGKLKGWLRRLGPPAQTDNANVHVARLDGEFVALTEVPQWREFDPATLDTREELVFEDLHEFDMITAHLVEDTHRDEHVGHALSFGRTHEYKLFRIPDGTRRREVFASIPTDRPAYVHSIGVSADHAILVETPLRIDLKRALSPFTEGFFQLLSWEPDRDTRFIVVDRDTGETVTEATVDPFFTFHVVNSYDDDDTVVVDLVAFEDDSIVGALSFDTLEAEGYAAAPPGRLVRFRIASDGTTTRQERYVGGIELPTVPRSVATRPYRYAYGQATDREGANGLVKVDTHEGTSTEWWEHGLYVEEPMPVQHPEGDAEDEGVVLAPALDVEREQSVLLIFDAATLEERARAQLPHHEPFGFHGRFFPS